MANSEPYLRLNNSKRTSNYQVILFYGTQKTQKLDRIGAPVPALRERSFGIFNITVAEHQKREGGQLDPLNKNFSKKSHTMPQKMKGGPFSLARFVYVALKKGTTLLVKFLGPNGPI